MLAKIHRGAPAGARRARGQPGNDSSPAATSPTHAYHHILKVARTIADLAANEQVTSAHVEEAVGYRVLDRQKGVN